MYSPIADYYQTKQYYVSYGSQENKVIREKSLERNHIRTLLY
jgi:hypothetical protein